MAWPCFCITLLLVHINHRQYSYEYREGRDLDDTTRVRLHPNPPCLWVSEHRNRKDDLHRATPSIVEGGCCRVRTHTRRNTVREFHREFHHTFALNVQ